MPSGMRFHAGPNLDLQEGLIAYRPRDRLALTDAGRVQAQKPTAPLTTEELQRRVLERLPGPMRKLLRVLLEVDPEGFSYAELAQQAGYAEGGGAFNNPRARLHSLGLITYPERSWARVADLLFLKE
ncbi:MAG TPA: hypothetical protein VKU02_01670 [Gemmataceae bacterium]|nr:hypothetical protein [Gemmataceae bacterium]